MRESSDAFVSLEHAAVFGHEAVSGGCGSSLRRRGGLQGSFQIREGSAYRFKLRFRFGQFGLVACEQNLGLEKLFMALDRLCGLLGAFAGFYGGTLDNVIMRVMDVLLAIPQTLLAIAIAAALGPGLYNLMIAVGISAVPNYARIVRGSVLSIRGMEYVEAARAVGSSDLRIILRHIIPNSMAPIIVQSTLGVASAILNAAGLSFIGLGI